jgi:phage shock protein A
MMWSRISKLFGKNKVEAEQDPRQALQLALAEMEAALERNRQPLMSLQTERKQAYDRWAEVRERSRRLEEEAKTALRKGQEAKAAQLLQQKAEADRQAERHEAMYGQLEATVRQLENQTNKLRQQIEHLHTQKQVLQAQLQSSHAQREIQQCLTELENSDWLRSYEDELILVQAEVEVSQGLISLTNELDADLPMSTDTLRQHLQAEELQARQQRLEQQFKKIELLMGQSSQREKQVLQAYKAEMNDRKQQLVQYFEQQPTPPEQDDRKKSLIDSFFEEPPQAEPPGQKQNLLDNFFNTTPEKAPEKPTDDKQKMMDDFFGNT